MTTVNQPRVADQNKVQEGKQELEKDIEDGLATQVATPEGPSRKTSPTRKPGFFSRARMFGPIEKDRGDLPLLVCCYVTGLVDAAVFSNWGVFVGMQTGNTVILGLSTAGLPANPHGWLTTLISIICFLIGAFLTFRISNSITTSGPNSNRTLASCLLLIQGLFILIAAILATIPGLIPQNPGNTNRQTREPEWVLESINIVALLPPLALQSGMQIASSRLLGFNELPINVLTSTYCDIMGDFKLFATNNVKRNRRCLAVVLLLAGTISAGWLMRSRGGLESVLWLGCGMKLVTAVAMWIWLPMAKDR